MAGALMKWPALFVNGLSAENRAELLTGVSHFLKRCSLSIFRRMLMQQREGNPSALPVRKTFTPHPAIQ